VAVGARVSGLVMLYSILARDLLLSLYLDRPPHGCLNLSVCTIRRWLDCLSQSQVLS
jgi:hypothetical protein